MQLLKKDNQESLLYQLGNHLGFALGLFLFVTILFFILSWTGKLSDSLPYWYVALATLFFYFFRLVYKLTLKK